MNKRNLFLLMKLAVSAGLIVLVVWRTDLGEIEKALRRFNFLFFGAALCSMVLGIFLRSMGWRTLLAAQGVYASLRSVATVTYISYFFNNFFLGTLGGDAYRVYRAANLATTTGRATSTVIMERAIGLLAALLIILFTGAALMFQSQSLVSSTMLAGILGVALCVGAPIVLVLTGVKTADSDRHSRHSPALYLFIKDIVRSLQRFADRPHSIVLALFIAICFHCSQSFNLYLFTLAVGADAPFAPLLFIAPLVGILVVLPISVNGVGVKEACFYFFLQQIGVAAPEALLVAVSGRVCNLVISLYGGVLFLVNSTTRGGTLTYMAAATPKDA